MNSQNAISLVPEPKQVRLKGGNFELDKDSEISWQGSKGAMKAAELLSSLLQAATGFDFRIKKNTEADISIWESGPSQPGELGFYDESYEIDVDHSGIELRAIAWPGLLQAVQTLRQLMPPEIYSNSCQSAAVWTVPNVHIHDEPAFKWRGLHLDVSRHFFSVEEVCRFLELMSVHRFNVFHWHLTDDQGWRIEIEKYPRLTETGSVRPCTLKGHNEDRPRRYNDEPYGGFYSKKDVQTILNFASSRGIAVVPEIDMPGHMQAAVSAYPELGNTDMTLTPRCHWGISQHILNPAQSTVEFMHDVLHEILELFPELFIHTGGDEALKHEWSESRKVQDRMLELGVNNEDELQSWFIGEMNSFLQSRGRRLIGWDEILTGGLPDQAAVMSWRNMDYGKRAARAGHEVVMAPKNYTYFDHYQAKPCENEPLAIGGFTDLKKAYSFNPVPDDLDEHAAGKIIGAQGQLWTEYIDNMQKLEYMTYPRACALSEVLWQGSERKGFPHFRNRMEMHRKRLKALDCNAGPL